MTMLLGIISILVFVKRSDGYCVSERMSSVSWAKFFDVPSLLCYDTESKFNHLRESLKDCTEKEINTDEYEGLVQEFCNPTTDFSKTFMKHKVCILEKLKNVINCIPRLDFVKDSSKTGSTYVYDTGIHKTCESTYTALYKCYKDKLEKTCGKSAFNAVKRIMISQKNMDIFDCSVYMIKNSTDTSYSDADDNVKAYVKRPHPEAEIATNGCSAVGKTFTCAILGLFMLLKSVLKSNI